jgi:predicted amidohydrolase
MKVGYLQFKPELLKPEINSDKVKHIVNDFKGDFDLLVMPELANSGYLFKDISDAEKSAEIPGEGVFTKTILDIANERNAYIVCGINEREGDKLFNSAILVSPGGKISTYRKTHLFLEEKLWFSPGNTGLNVFQISGSFGSVKIGMMVCFDWIFPEAARTLALKGAQIIAHPSNLVLSFCQQAMFTRAVENRVFTITANRTGTEKTAGKELFFTGKSVIVDTKGNYLSEAGQSNEIISVVEIEPSDALDKNVTKMNDIFTDRRTEFYS